MKKILLLLSAVAVMLTSCVVEGPEEPTINEIVLGADYVETEASSGQYCVSVKSDYAWVAYANVNWITVDSQRGEAGETTLCFTVAENTSTSIRQGAIMVTTDDYNLSAELNITQAAGAEEPDDDWVLLTDSEGNPAKGKFRGVAAFDGFWSGVGNLQEMIDVNIYKHKTLEQYKIEDPWVKLYVLAFGLTSEEDLRSQFSWTNADLIVDCTDPNNVIIPQQSIGIIENYYGYGEGMIYAEGGSFVDGCIRFPAEMIAYTHAALIESYGWFRTNLDGSFCIALPGVTLPEFMPKCDIMVITEKVSDVYPELSEQYLDDTSFVYAIFGTEISSAKYYIGDMATFERYKLEGGLTSEQVIQQYGVEMDSTNVSAISQRGYVDIAANLAPGTTYTVAVYAENIYGNSTVAEVNHTTTGVSSTSHPCEVDVITEKFSVVYPDYASQYPDYSALAYCIYGKELKTVKYLPQKTSTIESILNQGVTLEELVLAYGKSDADLTLVNSDAGWVSNLINLEPNTSYTIAVYAENIYGEKSAVSAVYVTDPITYTSELVIGDYRMYNKVVSGENEFEFENIFTIEPQVVNGTISETDFFVKNLGLEIDTKWYATYDATAGTFSISGVEYGYEDYGCQFGALYAYANQEQTAAMGFYSYATEDSQKGNDPLVFTVDATTKQLCALQNDLFIIPVLDMNTGEQIDTWGYYQGATTTVAPYTATRAAKASVKSVAPAKGGKSFAKVPFSSVKINKQLLDRKSSFRTLQSASVALEAANVKAFKARTVANLSIERLINKMKANPRSMQVKSNAVPACAKIAK